MDFAYTEEQLRIKKGIREWAKENLTEEVIAAGYKNRGIAPEVAKAWVDSGWGMYGLPEEHGGKPVDHQTMAMIIEELNHAGGNIPMAPNLLIMFDVCEFGTPEQIKFAMDYYKENGPRRPAWPSPSPKRALTTRAWSAWPPARATARCTSTA